MPNLHHSLHELPNLDEPKRKCPSTFDASDVSKWLDCLCDATGLTNKEVDFVDAMRTKMDKNEPLTEGQCEYIEDLYSKVSNDFIVF